MCCMMSWMLKCSTCQCNRHPASEWVGGERNESDKWSEWGQAAHLASTLIMDWTHPLREMDSTFESSIVQRWKRESNKQVIFMI